MLALALVPEPLLSLLYPDLTSFVAWTLAKTLLSSSDMLC